MADAEWDPERRGHIDYDTEPREVTTQYLDDPHTGAMLILLAVLVWGATHADCSSGAPVVRPPAFTEVRP